MITLNDLQTTCYFPDKTIACYNMKLTESRTEVQCRMQKQQNTKTAYAELLIDLGLRTVLRLSLIHICPKYKSLWI